MVLMSTDAAAELATRLAAHLDAEAFLSAEARRRLFAALVRAYARERREGEGAAPFAEGALTADEVVVTVADMMRAAEITSFELASLFNV